MSLVISHNFAASYAARVLEKNNDNLQNSLGKLASGKRIVRPTDDAAGMAVELKLKASEWPGALQRNTISRMGFPSYKRRMGFSPRQSLWCHELLS